MSTVEDNPDGFAGAIAERRKQLGWSFAEVANRTGLSRAYIHALERGRTKRPGADAVRRLEEVLGPLMPTSSAPADIPPGLAQIAQDRAIPASELRVLANLRIRGQQPKSADRWRFIYDALLASESIEDLSEASLPSSAGD